jgi:hypothetical protein
VEEDGACGGGTGAAEGTGEGGEGEVAFAEQSSEGSVVIGSVSRVIGSVGRVIGSVGRVRAEERLRKLRVSPCCCCCCAPIVATTTAAFYTRCTASCTRTATAVEWLGGAV